MAWNDPFEALVETIVEELGDFLKAKNTLPAYDITRTQEVCRDFCNFLCKDIHKAQKQDYAVYLQLHAMSAEDEADYEIMLSNIREFCLQSSPSAPNTQIKNQTPHQNNLDNTAINDLFTIQDSPKRTVSNNHKKTIQINPQKDSVLSKATPKKELSAVRNSTQSSESLAQRFNKFDFSLDKVLEEELSKSKSGFSAASKSVSHQRYQTNENTLRTAASISSQFNNTAQSSSKLKDSAYSSLKNDSSFTSKSSSVSNISNNNLDLPIFEFSQPGESNSNILPPLPENPEIKPELFKDVTGVNYHFDASSIRKMREFDTEQLKSEIAVNVPNPTDESLTGFRPYLFESKYTIDIPLPDPKQFSPIKTDLIARYLFPIAPTAILFVLALFSMTFHVAVGLALMLCAVLLLIVVLPGIISSSQQTPQATLYAYLNAKRGRCYQKAYSLLANSESSTEIPDLHKLWAPEESYAKAVFERFRHHSTPDTKTVTGAESQNKLLFIHKEEDSYWLLPMVRIQSKWYITDPRMTCHKLENPSDKAKK